jgi:hypothetical protein
VLSFEYLRYHLCVSIELHIFLSEEGRHSLTLVISTSPRIMRCSPVRWSC